MLRPKDLGRKGNLPGNPGRLAITIKYGCIPLVGLVATLLAATGNTQIMTDGSLGPARNLQGPDFVISNDLGTQVGTNLFHSFTDFNIDFGESATFTSNFSGATENIISRVSGNQPSYIDGLLRSTVPGADLWLMNPNGVFFGFDASLDLPAGLHVTTANYLRLADGGRFDTDTAIPEKNTLTAALPSAFGFLDGATGSIFVNTESISAPQISLVGGDVNIDYSSVISPGLIRISSVAGAGELAADPHEFTSGTIDLFGSTSLAFTDMIAGELYIESSSLELFNSDLLTYQVSGTSGDLLLKADDIGLFGSRLNAGKTFRDNGFFGNGEILFTLTGGNLRVEGLPRMDSAISIANTITIDDSHIYTYSESGKTGHISLRADTLDILNGTGGLVVGEGSIVTETEFGMAGDIDIAAEVINLGPNTEIYSTSLPLPIFFGESSSGNITIGGSLSTKSNPRPAFYFSGREFLIGNYIDIFNLKPPGPPGDIEIRSLSVDIARATILNVVEDIAGGSVTIYGDYIYMTDGTQVGGVTLGSASGPDMVIAGTRSTSISPSASTEFQLSNSILVSQSGGAVLGGTGEGDAGSISVRSRSFEATDGSIIGALGSAEFFTESSSGQVTLNVDDFKLLSGSRITAESTGAGDAGDIVIRGAGSSEEETTPSVLVTLEGSEISSDSKSTAPDAGSAGGIAITSMEIDIFGARISTDTSGPGKGGPIQLQTDELLLDGHISSSTSATGAAGSITVLGLTGQSEMRIGHRARGELSASSLGQTQILGDVPGPAGNITISAGNVLVSPGDDAPFEAEGRILSNNFDGEGGNINITANNFQVSIGGLVDASALGNGHAGDVNIDAENVLVTSGVIYAVGAPIYPSAVRGQSGNINIRAHDVSLANGAVIAVEAFTGADGGSVSIIAGNLTATNDSLILATAEDSSGGSIFINVTDTVSLTDTSIQASAQGLSSGDSGGNVAINGPEYVVLNRSAIRANANAGAGGNIFMNTGTLVQSADSFITATSNSSIDGQVTIDSINDLTATLVDFEAPEIELPAPLDQRCTPDQIENRSSLKIEQVSPNSVESDYLSGESNASSDAITLAMSGCH